MLMRHVAIMAGITLALMPTAASASVTYDFDYFLYESFTFTAPTFIQETTSVDSTRLSSCYALFSTCIGVSFLPSYQAATLVDQIRTESLFFGIIPGGATYDFVNGAFGRAGHYVSLDSSATLDVSVSAVPLPTSAPMFGAALLGLAGLGYAAKRRQRGSVA